MQVKFTLDGKTATICEEFTLAGITVPEGFQSDGISSPRWTWLRYHPFSKWCAAAFLHDFCIESHGYANARDIFKQALIEIGTNKVDLFLIYNAVRFRDWQRRKFGK